MFTSVIAGFKSVKYWIMGGLGALVLVLSVGLYVEHLRLGKAQAEFQASQTALKVSNASIGDLVSTIGTIKKTLQDSEANEKKLQDQIHTDLAVQKESDKRLSDMATKLRSKPVTNKEFEDAWNSAQ